MNGGVCQTSCSGVNAQLNLSLTILATANVDPAALFGFLISCTVWTVDTMNACPSMQAIALPIT